MGAQVNATHYAAGMMLLALTAVSGVALYTLVQQSKAKRWQVIAASLCVLAQVGSLVWYLATMVTHSEAHQPMRGGNTRWPRGHTSGALRHAGCH